MPTIYSWMFVFTSIYVNPNTSVARLALISAVITTWGVRLVYNYWRKGGYHNNHEDYRWVYVRRMFSYPERKVVYHIFNFTFTAFYQAYLLLALALPMWYIQKNVHQEPLNVMDGVFLAAMIGFFVTEIIADQQQWAYQTKKYKWLDETKAARSKTSSNYSSEEIQDFKRGFLIRGLFKYSRHPNFFGEICIWWTVYLFSVSSQFSLLQKNFSYGLLFNYSIVGTLLLNLLFLGSTWLTESITSSKYPEYAEYQKRVSRFIPFVTAYEPKKSK